MHDLELQAQDYRQARDALAAAVSALAAEVQAAKDRRMPAIKRLMLAVAEAEGAVRFAVGEMPMSFWDKPRTRTLHGVRIGYLKGKGKVVFDDAQAVCARIRRLLPEQAETLIRVREEPLRQALAELPADILRRLGVTLADAGDTVVVRDVAGELDKMLEALIGQLVEEEVAA